MHMFVLSVHVGEEICVDTVPVPGSSTTTISNQLLQFNKGCTSWVPIEMSSMVFLPLHMHIHVASLTCYLIVIVVRLSRVLL